MKFTFSVFAFVAVSVVCLQIEQATACFCTSEYNPVCGSNNRKYSNPCEFQCDNYRYHGGRLSMRYGQCRSILGQLVHGVINSLRPNRVRPSDVQPVYVPPFHGRPNEVRPVYVPPFHARPNEVRPVYSRPIHGRPTQVRPVQSRPYPDYSDK